MTTATAVLWLTPLVAANLVWHVAALPSLPARGQRGIGDMLDLLRRRYFLTGLISSMLSWGSAFTLFTYLHLAADRALTTALVEAGTTAVAYETVQLPDRSLPLLIPMSEIAGRLSVTMGSYSLLRSQGGRGMLLGGIAGTPRAKTVVIGGGVVGTHAAKVAAGMGADVTVLDRSLVRLRYLDDVFGGQFKNGYASAATTAALVAEAMNAVTGLGEPS